ncbi:MAG: T9SS type A sorting domain-containing protein [Salinivirgaceae bacterium]|jgi:hypothetical protein|nr:T9SS type A sorting domain-containing protein [Salinivirgaceae bacterium]
MKNLFLLLLLFSYFFVEAQQDTVHFEGECIGNKPTYEVELTLINGTLHLTGTLPANCCGTSFITYEQISNPFELIIDHSGDVCFCMCPYAVDHQFHGFTEDSVHVIIEPHILDTVIYDELNNICDPLQNKVLCYPTPSSTNTIITFPNLGKRTYTLSVYDQTGKPVLSRDNIRTGKAELKKGSLLPGIYFFTLSAQNTTDYRGKILISDK